jgi:hypothetical protein
MACRTCGSSLLTYISASIGTAAGKFVAARMVPTRRMAAARMAASVLAHAAL